MKRYATRIPKPVDVIAEAKRKAVKISQTVGLAKPEKTCAADSVFVTDSSVSARSAVTPMGTGCATSAMTVAAKIATRCRCPASSTGSGRRYSSAPGRRTTSQRVSLVTGDAGPVARTLIGELVRLRLDAAAHDELTRVTDPASP